MSADQTENVEADLPESNPMETRWGKVELLSQIDAAWAALNSYLDTLTPVQSSEIRDPAGWAAKDHVTHLAAWERSVVRYLQGTVRYVGLGISKEQYLSDDLDETNAVIQRAWQHLSVDEARAELRAVHDDMLQAIAKLSDADLVKSNSDYAPAAWDGLDERPISGMIYSNTARHFGEHQGWIENLLAKGA